MEINPTPASQKVEASISAAKPYHAGPGPAAEKGNGRGWILALAIMQTLGALVLYGVSSTAAEADETRSLVTLFILLGLAGIFFGLWIWGKNAPFAALLTAMIIFVTFHLLDAVVEPMRLLQGIIVKIIVLVGMGGALKQAYMRMREKELQS